MEQTFDVHFELQSISGLHLTVLVQALGEAGDDCSHNAIVPGSVEYSMLDLDLFGHGMIDPECFEYSMITCQE